MADSWFLCIDLKSFYASVECVERGLDPFSVNLVVADPERSKGTICLAITPAMKKLGIKNRCRIYEIPPNVEYIVATPRMKLYIDYSARIYEIYLRYIAKEDIHVYSIDEAFLDVTDYLALYKMTPKELGQTIISKVFEETGIRATCGIGTNLYLTKIALDITAKHSPDFIGILTEESYRELLWTHKPLTDFWMIGSGTLRRLSSHGLTCMKDIANCNEDLLYKVFGIDAELLIDHAYGRESCTMADIKNYRSTNHSLSSGQILMKDYSFDEAEIVVKEMADLVCLDLVDKNLVTDSLTLYVGYSHLCPMPPTRVTVSLTVATNADRLIIPALEKAYTENVNRLSPIRHIGINCNRVILEEYHQFSMFLDNDLLIRDRRIQEAVISIKNRYGKNSVLKGMNLLESATTITRNMQIGGHKSGESTYGSGTPC